MDMDRETLQCLSSLLALDPENTEKRECIRAVIDNISSLIRCQHVQFIEVVSSDEKTSTLRKYYTEAPIPCETTTTYGINHYCVVNQRAFIAKRIDHEEKIAYGLSVSMGNDRETREEQIPYILLQPERNEESALFIPLVRNKKCIGIIKLCDLTNAERFSIDDLDVLQPVVDSMKNLLYWYNIIEEQEKKLLMYDTRQAENEEILRKLEIGEKLTYQYLTAASHLHELVGLLGGMSSDREEFLSIVRTSSISKSDREQLISVIDRYRRHREEAHRKVTELLGTRPLRESLFIKPNNIKDLINEQLEVYAKQFENSNIAFKKSLKEADIFLNVDASALKYVIRIMLNNAIYAVNEGPNRPKRIAIYARRLPEELILRFIDNGIGIDPQIQNKIFDAFFTTKIDGSGIGLYWARKAINEDHNGKLYLERSFPRKGSRFVISLRIKGA